MSTPRTMLHVLHDQASRRQHRPALWSRQGRTYAPTSWFEYAQRVCRLSLGLRTLGFARGSTLPILASNREEWFLSALAGMALGGIPVGLYTTSSIEQLQYVVEHCEATVMVVEGACLERALELRQQVPRLRELVVIDPPPSLPEGAVAFTELLDRGSAADEGPYWDAVHALEPESLATLVYTSGTTGRPKGVMLSHRNLVWTAEHATRAVRLDEDDTLVCYLPLSHIAEQMISLHIPLWSGAQVYFASSVERLPRALQQARPTAFLGVPRVWEKLKERLERGLGEQPRVQQKLVAWARWASTERTAHALRHERVPLGLEAQLQVARRTVFQPLRESLGLARVEHFASGAAPISREVLDFFASLDMVIRESYGQSEACGPITLNTRDATRLGTVGRPLLGVEVRIAEDGEVLVRGGNVCLGYHRDPEATAALLAGGWLHTGDLGFLDSEGYLHLTGSKRELLVTAGGKKVSPTSLELLLRSIPPVGHALVVGERRRHLVALLTLDAERAQALARDRGWPEQLPALAADERLRQYLREAIERDVNSRVARHELIKRFAVLAEDFSVAGGELTPSLKLRRQVVEARYSTLLESLYAEEQGARGAAARAEGQ